MKLVKLTQLTMCWLFIFSKNIKNKKKTIAA